MSPNNPTSVGVADNILFSYDYYDKNPSFAYIDIMSGNTMLRRIGYVASTFTNLPTTGQPTLDAGRIRQFFLWDGKNDAGQYVAEGEYTVRAYVGDAAGNVLYVNGNYADNSVVKVLVDNTGSNISVVLPVKNYWTNVPTYNIVGGLGYLQAGKPNAYELKSLQINGTEVSLNPSLVLNGQGVYNYEQQVTLAAGENKITFQTTDQVGNKVTGFSQLDKNNLQVATDNTLNINYDPSIPKITSITDITSTTAPVNSKSLKISFSDTYSGVDISAINIDLYTSNKDSLGSFSANLIANSKPYPNTTVVDSFTCTQTDCILNLKNLNVSYYQLFVAIKDKSPNSSCTFATSPYACSELASFEKIIQVGTPVGGNLTSTVESNKSINDLDIFPTYDGVNSDQVMQQLKSGSLKISQVQGAKFRIKVSQGTEAVDIDFSDDTALGVVCASPNDTVSCKGRIATINAILDVRSQYEQMNANQATTTDSYDIAKAKGNVQFKKCEITECTWEYFMPYPKEFSGKQKLVVTSYRTSSSGEVLKEKKILQWEILGQIKTQPRVTIVNKVDSSGNLDNANLLNGVYYTNSTKN